jgi:hypothetical protein
MHEGEEATACLRDHAQHVLGVPVIFNTAMAWDRLPLLPGTDRRPCTSTPGTKQCAAMLMPRGGELFSIYIDEQQGMFVQAQGCADSLHLLDMRWSGLRAVMPADSACLAVAYRNRAGQLLLGVYDVLRVAASDTSKLGIFERQQMLHELFCQAPRADAIERHWVGIEECLLDYIQKRQNVLSVPFEVDHMLRLEAAPAPPAEQRPRYQRVLRPLQVS